MNRNYIMDKINAQDIPTFFTDKDELLTYDFAMKVALGAGLSKHESEYLLNVAPNAFLSKIEASYIAHSSQE